MCSINPDSLNSLRESPFNQPSENIGVLFDQQQFKDIALYILSFLTPGELGRTCTMSKKWNELTSNPNLWNAYNLSVTFPSVREINEQVWKEMVDLNTYGLDFKGLPPCDKRAMIPKLEKFFSRNHESFSIKNDAGYTLLDIPKGLSLNKMKEICLLKKEIFLNLSKLDGEVETEKPCRILITNGTIISKKGDLTQEVLENTPRFSPKALEASTLMAVTKIIFNEKLFSSNATMNYTLTCEYENRGRIVAGYASTFPPEKILISVDLFGEGFGTAFKWLVG